MNDYLDTRKSVIISAPAGSGKTEKLARRYISLLKDGAEIEKILAITFTEKAAAEMKDRILNILQAESEDIFRRMKEKIPLMRITTIHAFCRRLITRFALDLGLDPSLSVLDEHSADQLWSSSVYDSLRDEKDSPSVFFQYLKQKGIKGWGILSRALDAIHARRPYADFLTEDTGKQGSIEEDVLLEIYAKCLSRYREKKRELHAIDFNDMEILAYRAITTNPEWLNILYAFDEHTDHILVDEFQDTNSIQWKIIDKLTEEWRSGLGAKRTTGKIPTIFLVGDEKQSIYLFRGANVAVFHEVKKRLHEWFGPEVIYQEPKENYRSLPGIIRFTNTLFSQIMKGAVDKPWRTPYAPFSASREGNGRVELLLIDYESDTRQTRNKEASLIAHKIRSLVGSIDTYSDTTSRKCRFADIAILMRNRTHLTSFESALREQSIPYVVEGGIGFYVEPEVAYLRELVSFLIDPRDDFSLFEVLRSPLFGFRESSVLNLLLARRTSLYLNMKKSKSVRLRTASELLETYRARIPDAPLSIIIEEFLSETGMWKIFHETQRYANVKKFLRVLDDYASQGMTPFEIKESLIRSKKSNEAKAQVNSERLDAVKIMTIHGAKGRQFPVVFLPSLDERLAARSSPVFVDEVDMNVRFAYEEDSAKRRKNDLFILRREKEFEEEKRLFYVAVTRAMDHLFMTGALRDNEDGKSRIDGRLRFIEDAFPESVSSVRSFDDILHAEKVKEIIFASRPVEVTTGSSRKKISSGTVYIDDIDLTSASMQWLDVTEDIEIRTKHGEDWIVLGRVFHRLFEELSKGIISRQDIHLRIETLLSQEMPFGNAENYRQLILNDIKKLEASHYLNEIILPVDRAYAELPFVLQKGNRVYKGRIDRILVKDSTAYIYDYKTFPVRDREIPELIEQYRFQLNVYSEAVRDLFSLQTKSFILFTHIPLSVAL